MKIKDKKGRKVCNHCEEYTEGGTYIEEKGKKLYFCSGKCLEEYKKKEIKK